MRQQDETESGARGWANCVPRKGRGAVREPLDAILSDLGVAVCTPSERKRLLLPTLLRIQDELGHIPPDLEPAVARALGLSRGHVHGVVTFYPAFRRDAPGRVPSSPGPDCGGRGMQWAEAHCLASPSGGGQVRRVLARCGVTDPDSIDDYVRTGGYEGLRAALSMDPEGVMAVVSSSRLRGRGGAGFPVGAKWQSARDAAAEPRYIVCNAAEGDPGASMDRFLLDNDPHGILEGMLIAGYAVGASRGFIYVRAEYTDLVPRVRHAIDQARECGYLGERIAGSAFGFDIEVVPTAGRYVCGEETALLNSMEGERGIPRLRPPFPTQSGLGGRPTVVNNVKTLANVPLILRHGAEWFAEVGTEQSKGTAVLSLAGDIARPGVVEVPMGMPLREVIFGIGGGVRDGEPLKAVQTGGPMGGVIPASLVDTPVAFETMAEVGSPLGSGGLVVYGERRCMVSVAEEFARFACEESCGHCGPCRLGTAQVARLVGDIREGRAGDGDLDLLARIGVSLRHAGFCAFGQGACQVVLSTARHFRTEYEEHIRERRCRCGECAFGGAATIADSR